MLYILCFISIHFSINTYTKCIAVTNEGFQVFNKFTLLFDWVTLIIVPSFSFPSSARLLYIIGSNSSCLWMPSEIEIQNQIVDELSEFTWFNVETCTNGQRLTTPCSKSEITSSISIVSIMWWLFFLVESNRAWKKNKNKKNENYSKWNNPCLGSVDCMFWKQLC